jgi:hypothetical protein
MPITWCGVPPASIPLTSPPCTKHRVCFLPAAKGPRKAGLPWNETKPPSRQQLLRQMHVLLSRWVQCSATPHSAHTQRHEPAQHLPETL